MSLETWAAIIGLLALFLFSSCSPARRWYQVNEVRAVKDVRKNSAYLEGKGLKPDGLGGYWVKEKSGWHYYGRRDFRRSHQKMNPRTWQR
jgi:hypothetical protein